MTIDSVKKNLPKKLFWWPFDADLELGFFFGGRSVMLTGAKEAEIVIALLHSLSCSSKKR